MSQPIKLELEVQRDLVRYERLLEQYRSGGAVVSEQGPRGFLKDTSGAIDRHLENVIREFRALLRDR
jgi:hypothetical protein